MEKIDWSGRTSCYEHKHVREGDAFEAGQGKDAIRMVKVVDAQWSNMPIEAYEDVHKLWRDYGYGNDYYYHSTTLEELREDGDEYPALIQWLEERAVQDEEKILIRYWW